MRYVDKIPPREREKLYFEFTRNLVDKRILYKGILVQKFEVFATLLNESRDKQDMIYRTSKLLSGMEPDYRIVWRWELLGFRNRL